MANLNADTVDGKDSTDLLPGGILPAGATIRGTFEMAGTTSEVSQLVRSDSISFVYKLSTPPNVRFVQLNTTPPAECPGTANSPEANPGFLCIYESQRSNMVTSYPAVYNVSKVGAGMYGKGAAVGVAYSGGTWAVTAPTPAQVQSLSQEGRAAASQSRGER